MTLALEVIVVLTCSFLVGKSLDSHYLSTRGRPLTGLFPHELWAKVRAEEGREYTITGAELELLGAT